MEYYQYNNEKKWEVADSGNAFRNTLQDRFLEFAVKILQFLLTLPEETVLDVCRIQLSRSATSIGANYQEAQGAFSRKEFISKIGICLKESRESYYWLQIMERLQLGNNKIRSELKEESLEFIKILMTALKTARQKK